MKKFNIFLCLSLVVAIFASCGDKASQSGTQTGTTQTTTTETTETTKGDKQILTSKGPLKIGKSKVNEVTKARTFNLINSGTEAVEKVLCASKPNDTVITFTDPSNCLASIGAGKNCEVKFTFAPKSVDDAKDLSVVCAYIANNVAETATFKVELEQPIQP